MNIELLKKEVLYTICTYIEASQPYNATYDYCSKNNIQAGICAYCLENELLYLQSFIYKYGLNRNNYLCKTPWQIKFLSNYPNSQFAYFEIHNIRIKYLTKILNEIIYIEQMKQESKIYTYYTLISLFKF